MYRLNFDRVHYLPSKERCISGKLGGNRPRCTDGPSLKNGKTRKCHLSDA